LFSDVYSDLRGAIYSDEIEMNRFRQLVVNSVMATDIVDKDLKNLRNARWDKVFNTSALVHNEHNNRDSINRKATIVIEHLIQASDIAHTMQHWHIYRKWNEMFFKECYQAYKAGRSDVDPSINWYKGEIGFFDFYVIPLARKLKDCGVFGVSSDEYLNYAIKNRAEWESRGEEAVTEMLENINSTSTHHGSTSSSVLHQVLVSVNNLVLENGVRCSI
jgi:3'5'-cyclic nucleotide phosphodiesterase